MHFTRLDAGSVMHVPAERADHLADPRPAALARRHAA